MVLVMNKEPVNIEITEELKELGKKAGYEEKAFEIYVEQAVASGYAVYNLRAMLNKKSAALEREKAREEKKTFIKDITVVS